MVKPKRDPHKKSILKKHNTLHARPEEVTDELFQEYDFFDPQDQLQVKYEMLRRVRIDGLPIVQAVQTFGFSRPAFYKAMRAFDQDGLWGLLPAKKGPRRSHKLSQTVMDFIASKQKQDPSLRAQDLVILLQEEFGFCVHPRSIERALQRAEKKNAVTHSDDKELANTPSDILCKRYENLRSLVLSRLTPWSQASGLGVMLRSGMRVWMDRSEDSSSFHEGSSRSRGFTPQIKPAHATLGAVIADMILAPLGRAIP